MKFLIASVILIISSNLYCQVSVGTENKDNVTTESGDFESYCIREAASLMEVPSTKLSGVSFSGEVVIPAGDKTPNYKELGLELKENETQYFKISGSANILALKSLYVLRLNYKNSLK